MGMAVDGVQNVWDKYHIPGIEILLFRRIDAFDTTSNANNDSDRQGSNSVPAAH